MIRKLLILFFVLGIAVLYPKDITSVKLQKTEKTLGVGFIALAPNIPYKLYASKNDKDPFDTVMLVTDEKGGMYFQSVYFRNQFLSYGFNKTDPVASMSFRVIENTKKFYKIILDENTLEIAFIKKDKKFTEVKREKNILHDYGIDKQYEGYYVYETWEDFLRRAEYIYADKTVIYDKPKGKIIFDTNAHSFAYEIKSISGNYIKVRNYFDKKSNAELADMDIWIKWKEGGRLFINIVEFLR